MSNLGRPITCRVLCAMGGVWLLCIGLLPVALGQPTWDERFGIRGCNGPISRILVHENALYVAGGFTYIDGVANLNGVAKWDGTNWLNLGSGVDGTVMDMAIASGGLYICGNFPHAGGVHVGGVARWDGTNWWPVGNGTGIPYGEVKALAIQGSNVFVGGYFTAVDDVEVYNLAKWDGRQWSPAATSLEVSPNGVLDLAVSGGVLYGAGDFYSPDRQQIVYLARWNGINWETPVGGGVNYFVWRLESFGEKLYAFGPFRHIGNIDVNGFACWDGIQWSVPASLTNADVSAVTWDGVNPYFSYSDGVTNRYSRWDGTNLTTLATADVGAVDLAILGGMLYAKGWFSMVNGKRTGNLVKFDGTNWDSVKASTPAGLNGTVFRIASTGQSIFAAGEFSQAGDAPAVRVARWNGAEWEALSRGINGPISDITTKDSDAYVVGRFTSAGGMAATNVARWNGTMWEQVGSGLLGSPTAIAVQGGDIYAAGAISLPGSDKTWNIVRWDGSQWAPVADGVGPPDSFGLGFISALAAMGGDLYVAGNFLTAGGISVNHIAKWTTQGWQPLGTGLRGKRVDEPNLFYLTYVDSLAVDAGNLYVGGSFTNAGGVAAANIAKWDGSKWSALGNGLGRSGFVAFGYVVRPVKALAAKNGVLYAGGDFSFLTRWDGRRWSAATGGGVNSYVTALAANGDDLCVGGPFSVAGTAPSYYFGILHGGFLPSLWPESSGSGLRICWPAEATNYVVQSSLAGLGTSWHDVQDQTETANGVRRLRVTASSPQTFFRLRRIVGN